MTTNTNYGPLAPLIGTWVGSQGMDHSPEPDGADDIPFEDHIVFEAIGDVVNAEAQTLMALRYHQVVRKLSNAEVFHNESGYLNWDAETGQITQSLTIPRGVSLVASGTATTDQDGWTHIKLSAGAEDIAQSKFMLDNARTTAFSHTMSVREGELSYSETTMLEIYGREFAHTDENVLTKQE